MKLLRMEYETPQICSVSYDAEDMLCGSNTNEGYNPETGFDGGNEWE